MKKIKERFIEILIRFIKLQFQILKDLMMGILIFGWIIVKWLLRFIKWLKWQIRLLKDQGGFILITCPLCKGKKTIHKKLTDLEKAMGAFPDSPCPECFGTGEVTLTEDRIRRYNLRKEVKNGIT